MIQRITKVPALPKGKRDVRVAAYARVSTGKDAMLHSLASQVSHYSAMIQSHPGWEFAGVYSDEAVTGTKADRAGFSAMMEAASRGDFSILLVKSISRLARNTVDLLSAVRRLKGLGIDVWFEEQGIRSLSGEGELMLTILASYAQEESRSASENIKWRIRRDFEQGIPTYIRMYGYAYANRRLVPIPEEAADVRDMFGWYLSGDGLWAIAKRLNARGRRTVKGKPWTANAVSTVLRNADYTGDITLQKTYRVDHLSKRKARNDGALPKYRVEESHEAIVGKETFAAAQAEMARRGERFAHAKGEKSPYAGKVLCPHCGRAFKSRVCRGIRYWMCPTAMVEGRAACPSRQIPERALADAVPEPDAVESATALEGNVLLVRPKGGEPYEARWKDPSRRDSWTPEMKERARRKALEQWRKKNG